MTEEEAVERIEAAIEKVASLRKGVTGSPQHVAFVQTTGLDLERIFGPNSTVTMNFSAIHYRYVGTFLANPLNIEQVEARRETARWGCPPRVPGYFSHPSAQVLRTSCCMSKGVANPEEHESRHQPTPRRR